jgi:hypothetical protein
LKYFFNMAARGTLAASSAERYLQLKNPLAREKYEITPSPFFTQTPSSAASKPARS